MRSLLFFVAVVAWCKPVEFTRDVRPILSDACFQCHGPDDSARKAGLRLDTRDGAFAKAIVPGKAAESLLVKRITHASPVLHMPPRAAKVQLTEAQVATLRQWIDEGAKWEEHWAYQKPVKPAAKSIDEIVKARLVKEGLAQNPPADKATLLRRVTLDLTGLPPTPAEVDAFLADKSAKAYEKAVDRLLASPHYGEKQAMHWLDLARYADTHGFHIDSHRDMWPWRDWLIGAFNRNMPYDQFTIWQLAGDLLPNATREQKVASGFNRNHVINYEGGAIPEEYQTEYVVDRVEATSTTWLGLTMGCARCHDHKYDPIKQKDFYRFFAYFNNVAEKGLDGQRGNAAPVLSLPTETQAGLLKEINEAVASREKQLEAADVPAQIKAWEARKQFAAPNRAGLLAHYEFEGNMLETTGSYKHGRYLGLPPTPRDGPVGQAATFDSTSQAEAPAAHDFDSTKPFALAFWFRGGNNLDPQVILQQKNETGWLFTHDTIFNIGDLRRGAHLIVKFFGPGGATLEMQTTAPFGYGDFVHFTLNYDGKGQFTLLQDGKPAGLKTVRNTLNGANFRTSAPLTVTKLVGTLDDLRIYNREVSAGEAQQLAVIEPVRYLVENSGIRRTKEQAATVREFYLTYEAPEATKALYARLQQLKRERKELEETIPTTMVMEERAEMRETHLLIRGAYDRKGEKLTAATPGFLPPLPPGAASNRLGLAQWLVSGEHPLTARVAVNRMWAQLFGTGLVKTVEDFGSQGEMPSHPELLDYLAVRFVELGWDMKAMQREMVLSATYRQSSKVRPELKERDPENRLLARMSRFRLQGESVRDNALAVSGLLNAKVGGKSVSPYQPPGLWEDVAYGAQFTAQRYEQSHGEDLYRRGMYSFWKRTLPPATLATFDAPDREKCVARRATTNTPLQALALWNDPTFLEAARHLAERTLRAAGPDRAKRLRQMFRTATARYPTTAELALLDKVAGEQLAEYRAKPAEAAKLVAIGESKTQYADAVELAAYTSVASAILNLDEVITKE
ncbi:MAG: DUF1553 domain-containing protein [Acidobacteria bacterium]|jgi:hypothetical protein|nr:DUF1553 domain-containing protein [Bryobacteraceae bacterium CoA2 C42]